jgi:RIO kinase 1
LLNRGIIQSVSGVVDAGKESRVYAAEDARGKSVALKIYLTSSSEFRKGILQYIDGDERFRRVKRDTRQLIYSWTKKEFRNLHEAQAVGVRVPKPYTAIANVLAMEFIGEAGERDPLLRERLPTSPERFLLRVLDYVRLLYLKAHLVHADLSEYNIMVQDESPVFIDFAQGVLWSHPLADTFLKRDIKNTLHFFSRGAGIKTPNQDEVYAWVKGEKPSFRYASS